MIKRTGVAELWLVRGGVPHYKEMVKLGRAISQVIVNEYGTFEFIKRLSNPLWFTSLSCVLGWEYWTSGQTTVTLKALKEALSKEDLGIKVAGGKGLAGRKVPQELIKVGDDLSLSSSKIEDLKYASQISAKVDSSALQDLLGQIYFHAIIVDEKGNWSVCQQKMDAEEQIARRYHWLCDIKNFIEEPHTGIIGDRKQKIVLDLTSKKSRETRKNIVDVVNDTKPERLQTYLSTIQKPKEQKNLLQFIESEQRIKVVKLPEYISIPRRFNLNILSQIFKNKVENFEVLLSIKGIGPSTVRGLAFISDLIYGTETSFKDPIKYSWAFGAKSGKPFMVQKKEMVKSAEILRQAVEESKLGKKEKMQALRRLRSIISN